MVLLPRSFAQLLGYHTPTMEWKELSFEGNSPCPRYKHGACLVPERQGNARMLIFGGCDDEDGALNDLYFLDLATTTWSTTTSISLVQAASIFTTITSLASFSSPSTLTQPSSVPTRLQTSEGTFSLDLLHAAATHRPQHAFARAIFSAITASLLAQPLPL